VNAPGEDLQPGPVRVLVIEDDESFQHLVVRTIEAEGREIRVVGTAEEARAALNDEAFDAIVLDLFLPDGDGRELLVEIRERTDAAAIPVVVLSSHSGRGDQLECFRLGADDFFEKPFDPPILAAAVDRQLERASRERARTTHRTDPETGLSNRAALVERFAAERRKLEGEDDDRTLLVAIVRIEGERDVRDEILFSLAAHLEASADDALWGRWGPASLVGIFPDAEAEALRRRVEETAREAVSLPGDGIDRVTLGLTEGRREPSLRDAVLGCEGSAVAIVGDGATKEEGRSEEVERRPPTVLMVEDDETSVALARHRLERNGFEVEWVARGDRALELLEDDASPLRVDLVLLDVRLPGAGGFEILRRLREKRSWDETPVLLLTSLGREEEIARAFELGADDYVLKPFSPTELLARIRRLLRGRRGATVANGKPGKGDPPGNGGGPV